MHNRINKQEFEFIGTVIIGKKIFYIVIQSKNVVQMITNIFRVEYVRVFLMILCPNTYLCLFLCKYLSFNCECPCHLMVIRLCLLKKCLAVYFLFSILFVKNCRIFQLYFIQYLDLKFISFLKKYFIKIVKWTLFQKL